MSGAHRISLIHDDLPAMDDDELRRGKPTCHFQFDEATAILAGDALLTYAFELLTHSKIPDSAKVNCVRSLAVRSGYSGMVGGQMADTVGETHEPNRELMDYIHAHKTGDLITCACELGAYCAEASADELERLRLFGRHCGLAFQVSDDICDHTSTSEEMGKQVGKDDDAGKQNAVRVHGMRQAREIVSDSVEKACEALEIFGSDAQDLVQLVRWLKERRS
ncbi:MAG: polyprenyl synthetase family protein [Planctomycetota bacterium]|nr:polyprenyl synthetase family protein [Planctomycetota bacterium]